ncbi:MAG TPA: ABC transporter substrate-binding protein [Chloroflexota bacterium]|nr:ABC transporter substrate-binding protein [Chloroflexota bacterium]
MKIAYWGKWGGTSKDPEEAVIANFQQKFPHITVEGLEDSQVAGSGALDREKFTTALAAGTPPETIKIDRFKMGGYGAKQVTTILDDLIKRDKIDIKKFYDATVQEVLYPPAPGGKITALPWNTDDRALYYNRQHFIEAGLDPNKPPLTWEDVLDVGMRLTVRQGADVVRAGWVADGSGTNWNIGYHWSAGGRWLKEGEGAKPNRRAAFNDEIARRWMQFVKESQDRIFGNYDAQVAWQSRFGSSEKGAWWNDGLSMGVTGVWELGNFKRWGPHIDFGVAPPPRPKGMEGTPTTWAGGFALAIPIGIKGNLQEAAWEFLKYYCYGKESQVLFGSATGQMPALIEAAEDKAYKESDPHMPVFVDIMKHAKIRDVTPAGDEVWFNNSTNERPYAMFNLITLARRGQQSVSEILNEAEQYINRTLDEAWARAGA